MESIFFLLATSFIFIHELDAIRHKEWKLFLVLKDLEDHVAYPIWLFLHLPFFLFPLFAIAPELAGDTKLILRNSFDIFLIIHLFLHLWFRKHPDYKFHSVVSNLFLYSAAGFGLIDLITLI
ncbi:MAG: hypothetical protein O9301_04715 [Leptospira sp.]|nr:hypothetical protein [Leptospira sp.]